MKSLNSTLAYLPLEVLGARSLKAKPAATYWRTPREADSLRFVK